MEEVTDNPPVTVPLDQYPPGIKHIMVNEICERFSFYGLRAILELYFINNLLFSDNESTFLLHIFIFFAYFCTAPGAFVSDTFWGKYKTIVIVSILYCFGSISLAVSAIPSSVIGTVISLFLLGIGIGGIKACVSAFIGDQFVEGQEALLEKVFGYFYFCINLGSFFSTIITPMLREYVHPSVAFALPAFLLIIATMIFWSGRKQYRYIPPQGSVLTDAFRVYKDAVVGWSSTFLSMKRLPSQSFWSYAEENNSSTLVEDIAATARVLKVFLFIPIFWSLFDQHGSRWVLQANQMNRDFYFFTVTGDQVPTLNPLFTLSLIPVFQSVFYPAARRILGAPLKQLEHKMVFGMFIAGGCFVLSGLLQVAIDNSSPNSVHVVAQIPQYFFLSCAEIMVSVTGLEVAYSQAPSSMKAMVMAGWQMTVAVGNLFVAIIAAINYPKELVTNFFLYALLMFGFSFVFMLYVRNYEYRVIDFGEAVKHTESVEYFENIEVEEEEEGDIELDDMNETIKE